MALARAVRGNVQPLMQSFARQEFVPETPRIVNTTLNRRKMNQKKVQPCLWRPNLQALSNGALQGVLLLNIRPAASTLCALRKSLSAVNGSVTSQVLQNASLKGIADYVLPFQARLAPFLAACPTATGPARCRRFPSMEHLSSMKMPSHTQVMNIVVLVLDPEVSE